MSKLYIAEYVRLTQVMGPGGVVAQCPEEPPIAEQVIDYSGGAAQSAAFNAKTKFIRIHTDAICSVLIGTNPTATTSKQRLAADQTEFKGLPPDHGSGSGGTQQYKISSITNT